MNLKGSIVLSITLLTLFSCTGDNSLHRRLNGSNISTLPSIVASGGVNAVIEIPSGTNKKIEYNKEKNKFSSKDAEGKIRIVDFLPYPGNYGFVPNTLYDTSEGGDGDALDILVLSESLPSATILEVLPIACLILRDRGLFDPKIVAIPKDTSMQVMSLHSYQDFVINFDAAKKIIEDWFLHYKGLGPIEFVAWKDSAYAINEIKKWTIEKSSN